MAFEQLGPTFIKLGQLLATRPDLIPVEFVEEFKKLHSSVQPTSFEELYPVIEAEFGDLFRREFTVIDEEPLAAASIAQVHRAVLKSGENVVVKIQRPGIIETINEDLGVLYQIANLVERYIPELKIYEPVKIVDEFFKTLELETDFVVEANNIRRFAENFKDDEKVKIPEVYLKYSGHRVLVLEELQGTPLSEPGAMDRPGIDKEAVVSTGLKTYFKMVFQDGFFHGDLHAGNFFVLEDNVVGLIDFGVVGRLNRKTQDAIASMLVALAMEDYDRVAYEYVDLAPYVEGLDVDGFAKDLRDLVAPYYGLTMKNINVGKILMDSAGIAAKHRLRVPSELMLYFKSMISIESLGREMIQDFDFLKYALEFAGELVKTKFSPRKVLKDLAGLGRDTTSLLYDLPRQLRQLIRKVNSPDFVAKMRIENAAEIVRAQRYSGDLSFMGLTIAGSVIAGAMSLDFATKITVLGLPLVSAILFGVAAFTGSIALFRYIRN